MVERRYDMPNKPTDMAQSTLHVLTTVRSLVVWCGQIASTRLDSIPAETSAEKGLIVLLTVCC